MNLTKGTQNFFKNNLSLEDILPTQMPTYVNSFAYLFGVITLSSFVLLFITGPILAIFGPEWYHVSGIGRFCNSVHYWSSQLFFIGMVSHLLVKFFMSAWRDGRWLTWMVGLITLFAGIFTALTGYLSQTNWDGQWIAVQAKDAMNAVGVGAFFNTMNTGQVLTLHVAALPAILLILVILHIFLVRRDGPVKPLSDPDAWIEPGSIQDVEWLISGKRPIPPKPKAAPASDAKKESGGQNEQA